MPLVPYKEQKVMEKDIKTKLTSETVRSVAEDSETQCLFYRI